MEAKANIEADKSDPKLTKELDGSVTKTVQQTVTRTELENNLKTAAQSQTFLRQGLSKADKEVAAAQDLLDKYDKLDTKPK